MLSRCPQLPPVPPCQRPCPLARLGPLWMVTVPAPHLHSGVDPARLEGPLWLRKQPLSLPRRWDRRPVPTPIQRKLDGWVHTRSGEWLRPRDFLPNLVGEHRAPPGDLQRRLFQAVAAPRHGARQAATGRAAQGHRSPGRRGLATGHTQARPDACPRRHRTDRDGLCGHESFFPRGGDQLKSQGSGSVSVSGQSDLPLQFQPQECGRQCNQPTDT